MVVHRAATNIASHDALFYARAPVKARTICTGHSTNIAVLAIETPRTYTLVVIFQVLKRWGWGQWIGWDDRKTIIKEKSKLGLYSVERLTNGRSRTQNDLY